MSNWKIKDLIRAGRKYSGYKADVLLGQLLQGWGSFDTKQMADWCVFECGKCIHCGKKQDDFNGILNKE